MSPTPRTSCAIPLLLAGLGLGGFACLDPNQPGEPAGPAKLDEDSPPLAAAAPASDGALAATATEAPLRSFVAGELLVELEQKLVAHRAIELDGLRLTPVEQLRDGAWRVLLPATANTHAAVAAGRPIDDDTLAAAEQLTLEARAAIARAPGVRDVYVNGYLEYSSVPTDPFYEQQRWHYEAVRLPAAWSYGGGHGGVRLAIIDSETDQNQHSDLVGKWSDSFSFTTLPQTYHHGAHVAGIAGGSADGLLGVGVCWGCRLLPYRMDRSFGQIGQAIDRAAGDDLGPIRAEVINLSMNRRMRPSPNQNQHLTCNHPEAGPVRIAIARAIARRVMVVVSAGNFGHFGDIGPAFPADCPDVISVAAIQPGGFIADYSNRGAGVTLAAPGGGGLEGTQFGSSLDAMPCPLPHTFPTIPPSTDPFNGTLGVVAPFAHYADPIATNGYCYRHLSGTSMSAPHVTGAVGLMRSRNNGLSPAQAKDILVRTAQPATACPAGLCGAGLLDAHAATRYAPDAGVPTATLSAAGFGNVAVGSTAQLPAQLASTGSATVVAGHGGPMRILGGGGQIEFAYASGPCTSGISCAVPVGVAAGSSQPIPLRCRPTSAGVIAATLQLPTNRFEAGTGGVDAAISVALSCTGVIAPPEVTVTPTALAFGGVRVPTPSAPQPFTVRNDGGGTLAVTVTESSADYAVTCQNNCACPSATCTASLAANQTATFAVTFTPLTAGSRDATLTIATPGDPDEPSTLVSLSGVGTQSLLEVRPSPLHVGAVHVGSSGFAYGTLYNPGDAPLFIFQMSFTGSSAGIFSLTCGGQPCAQPLVIPAGTGRSIEVHCTPTRNAPYGASLLIGSDAPSNPSSHFVQCQGLAPEIAVTPSGGVAFGVVAVGATATAPVGIHDVNAGLGTNLSWSASVSTGPYQLGCLSAQGCSCAGGICTGSGGASLQLAYSPGGNGASPATLTVLSNDPDRPVVTRPITGTGQIWLVREEPATRWIEVNSGSGATTVRVRNQGPSGVTLQNARILDLDPGSAAFFSLTGPTTGTIASGAAATWGVACNSSKVRTATFELLHDVPGAGSYRTTVRCGQLSSEPLPEPPGFPPNPPSEPM